MPTKRKFSPAQIAAQKLFAARARAGQLQRKGPRVAATRNPKGAAGYVIKREYPHLGERPRRISRTVYKTWDEAEAMAQRFRADDPKAIYTIVAWKGAPPARRNPKAAEFGKRALVIRATVPTASGYRYLFLRNSGFVSSPEKADKFSQGAGERRMREILPQLPPKISSITLVRP